MVKPRWRQLGTLLFQRARFRAIAATRRPRAIQRCRRGLARRSSREAAPSSSTDFAQPIAGRVARAHSSRDRWSRGRARAHRLAAIAVGSIFRACRESRSGRASRRIDPGAVADQRNGARPSDRGDSSPRRPDRRAGAGNAIPRGADHSAPPDNARGARDVRRADEGSSRDRAGAGYAESVAASFSRINALSIRLKGTQGRVLRQDVV